MNNRIRQKLIWKKYIKQHYFPIHELTDEVMAKLIDREEGVIMEEVLYQLDADTLEEFLELSDEELMKWGYNP